MGSTPQARRRRRRSPRRHTTVPPAEAPATQGLVAVTRRPGVHSLTAPDDRLTTWIVAGHPPDDGVAVVHTPHDGISVIRAKHGTARPRYEAIKATAQQ